MGIFQRVQESLGLGSPPPVQVGQQAPPFQLTDSDGQTVSLADVLATGPAILAFFPKAFTGGCTRELRAYRDRHDALSNRGARLVAISMDDPATLARFKASLNAPYTFLSDPDGTVSRLYAGVSLGTSNRVTITIDQNGRVARVTRGIAALFPDADIAACPVGQARAGTESSASRS